jgi:two-component system NtrC family sensor kinase
VGQTGSVRLGLRLQILLLLGGLLLLAFVPLYYAVATYTSYTLQQVRRQHTRSLGRAVAGHVAEARARRTQAELMQLLEAEIGAAGVEAIGVYGTDGRAVARAGEPSAVDALPAELDPAQESISELTGVHGPAMAVAVPDARGAVLAILRTDDHAARAAPLIRLVGLYSGLVALVLLVLAYFALTRLIVRPLDALSRAAERVAGGARHLDVPRTGARELVDLGLNVRTMTERILSDEQALRRKIDEVEQATRELRDAQQSLVRSERLASVGRLAAGLAHEVGNPIAALIGMENLLLEGGLEPEQQRDFLQRMRKETERINRILGDLLQFARPRAADAQSVSEPGQVEVAIHETVTLVRPQRSMRDVDLHLDIHPDLPEVSLSREHLVQVMLNLLLNAADAVSDGGRISVRAQATDEGIRVEVEDSGPGVPAQVRERLFEPFVTTKEVGKGTGLGLAVCRGLIEAVGGKISLAEEYADGARFVIELPRARRSLS